jgi:hypothetical protein
VRARRAVHSDARVLHVGRPVEGEVDVLGHGGKLPAVADYSPLLPR